MRRIATLREGADALVRRAATQLRQLPRPGAGRDYRRFVIVSPGRSGSTMLVERCASHPDIRCFTELLHEGRSFGERPRDPATFLERHAWHPYARHVGAVGFKLLYSQLVQHRAALQPVFADPGGLRVIWLERRDRLALYLSALNSTIMGFTNIGEGAPVPRASPRRVDPADCHRFFKTYDLMVEVVRQTFGDHMMLRLDYADLASRPEQLDAPICAFLGVPRRSLRHGVQKLAQGSVAERVGNLDELLAYFAGTRWESQIISAAEGR